MGSGVHLMERDAHLSPMETGFAGASEDTATRRASVGFSGRGDEWGFEGGGLQRSHGPVLPPPIRNSCQHTSCQTRTTSSWTPLLTATFRRVVEADDGGNNFRRAINAVAFRLKTRNIR